MTSRRAGAEADKFHHRAAESFGGRVNPDSEADPSNRTIKHIDGIFIPSLSD